MSIEELKDAVCELVSNSEDLLDRKHFEELDRKGVEIINCLDELNEYRKIGNVERLKALEEKKDIPTTSTDFDKLLGRTPDYEKYPGCGYDRSWCG